MARVRRYTPPEREPVTRICGGRRRAAASEALPLSRMPVAISASPALPVQAIMIQRPRPSMLQELLAKHPPILSSRGFRVLTPHTEERVAKLSAQL